jgi:hypothetical protein
VVGHVRELAREHTELAVGTLISVMKNTKSPPAARVAAATAVLDRGYGRPGPTTTVRFRLPELSSAGDANKAMTAIAHAVAQGELTPTEAAELSRLVEAHLKSIEISEFDQRLRVLEERDTGSRGA